METSRTPSILIYFTIHPIILLHDGFHFIYDIY